MTSELNPIFAASRRWPIFLVGFVVLFIITALAAGVVSAALPDERASVLVISIIQGAISFILPCWITWQLTSCHPARETGVDVVPSPWNVAGILTLYLLALPALNQTIYWNAGMNLPDSMHDLELWLKQMESNAEQSTMAVVNVTGVGDLVVNILVLGVFTGIAEEFLFRAGIQRMMIRSGINAHAAVWIAAFVFSAVHFQFFGFIPRLLLGAAFGYIYLWSGSIWNAALAHAFNNSFVVVFAWLKARNALDFNPDMLGVSPDGIPWIAIASAAATILFIIYERRRFFAPNHK